MGEAVGHDPALRLALQAASARLAQTPAKQSACSSTRTDTALASRLLMRSFICSVLALMPKRFWT